MISLALLAVFSFSTGLYAQGTRTITGTVVDQTGEPLPGAAVAYMPASGGQSYGAVCNAQGIFSLSLPADAEHIMVTFIGYQTQDVALTQANNYRIVLAQSATEVEAVVVTGMFTRNAQTYTGAVTTIDRETLLSRGNQNILQSIRNVDPSLVLVENLAAGSNPNAMPELQLRGQTAFPDLKGQYQNNPNQPLFILDGFETELTKIMDLDINLVESITLLKDATAKAIYGSKAANGVIVVETRKPEAGRIRINYTGTLNVEIPDLTSYDLANAYEKLEIEKMAGLFVHDNVIIQNDLNDHYNTVLKGVLEGVDTDWLAQPVRTGVGQKHSLYLEGGEGSLLYGVDLSYNNIIGAMKGSSRNTFTGGVNLTYRTKNLLFRNKLSVSTNTSNESPWGDFEEYALMNPYYRIHDDNGKLLEGYSYYSNQTSITETNPIWNSQINTKNVSKYLEVSNNFYAEWSIKPTLKVVGRLGLTQKKSNYDNFKPASHTNFANFTGDDIYRKGTYIQSNGDTYTMNADLGVNYSVTFADKHLLFMNAQGSISDYSYDDVTIEAEGFPNDNMDHIIFALQYLKDGSPYGSEAVSRSVGGVASVNYSYDNRYLFDANYRLTGSSEFGVNNRWGSFWSLGAGWNLHNEKFLENAAFINRLKIRGSLGYTGSQGFTTNDALATLKYYSKGSYNGQIGSYLAALANPNLKWQKKYDQNIGLDATLFNNSLTARFDYYNADTEGMLTDVTVPQSTGFTTYRENLGEVNNKGWEAYLNWRVWKQRDKNNFVNVFASVARNKNTLNKISESLRAYNDEQDEETMSNSDEVSNQNKTRPRVKFVEGQSMTAIWAVRSLGIDPANGQEIFLTKDDDRTYTYSANDQVVCGDTQPKINGIVGISAEYAGFGVNVTLNYQLGGKIYNSTLVDKVENADLRYNVDRRVFSDRWNKAGDNALYKNIQDFSLTRPTSRFVEDYNVLNFASVNVYYDFRDHKFLRNSFIERLKLNVYMNNFATISSVKVERGTDYPFARNISFSVQATF